jgi:Xaa-Pro aminopeptidase
MKMAIDISTKAFRHILDLLREGAVESEIAFEMECFMKKKGSDAVAFDTIVASGKRSALPHGKASPKRIEKGDLILIDFGCRFQGYHSDETCTAVLGQPSPEQRKVHQVVKDAHDKAIEGVRPGIPISEVDGIARNHIRDCGYGDYFGHGLGHGVGLAVHEEPGVNGENKGVVEEGMVFTIEPGIYIPDRGGVRLEDMILVTSQGAEILTTLPKELIML